MFINKAPDGKNNICGATVARLRKALGISQRELADRLQLAGFDIEKNGVQRIESGQRFVTDIELGYISNVLAVDVDVLLVKARHVDFNDIVLIGFCNVGLHVICLSVETREEIVVQQVAHARAHYVVKHVVMTLNFISHIQNFLSYNNSYHLYTFILVCILKNTTLHFAKFSAPRQKLFDLC